MMLLGAIFGFVDFYFRKHLDERERTEMNFQSMEKKYSEVISQLSSIITVDEMSSATFTVEEIVRKAGSVFESSILICYIHMYLYSVNLWILKIIIFVPC